MKLNKKANLFDYITVWEFLLGIVIFGFLSFTILSALSANVETSGLNTVGNNYSEFIDNSNTLITASIDWGALLFLVGAIIFSVIAAKKLPTDPKTSALIIIISFVLVFISFVLSNVFGGLMDNSQISEFVLLNLPITNILLRYFPFITLIYLAVVLIAFFNKTEDAV
jgi:hypothetical protein